MAEKKAVCQGLTKVLKRSPLKDSVDPKAFFMMLTTNYQVLCQEGGIDLKPIWDALSENQEPESLYGLFLKLADKAGQLGLNPTLPAEVASLTPEEREQFLLPYQSNRGTSEVVGRSDDELDPVALQSVIPLSLDTGDIKPFIPDDVKRQVTMAAVGAIRSSPIGQHVETGQLGFLIDNNFDSLCDGLQFKFEPILGGLRDIHEVSDGDIFIAAARLQKSLKELRIEMEIPQLDVSPAMRERLLLEAEKEPEPEPAERRSSSLVQPSTDLEPKEEKKKDEKGTVKERRLREYGLIHNKRLWAIIRYSTMAVLAIAISSYGFFNRPNRALDLDDFEGTLPLATAVLKDGCFSGVLDGRQWYKWPPELREQKLTAFENILRDRGLVHNLRIVDKRNQLVVTTSGLKIVGSAFLMYADETGKLPKNISYRNTPKQKKKKKKKKKKKEKAKKEKE